MVGVSEGLCGILLHSFLLTADSFSAFFLDYLIRQDLRMLPSSNSKPVHLWTFLNDTNQPPDSCSGHTLCYHHHLVSPYSYSQPCYWLLFQNMPIRTLSLPTLDWYLPLHCFISKYTFQLHSQLLSLGSHCGHKVIIALFCLRCHTKSEVLLVPYKPQDFLLSPNSVLLLCLCTRLSPPPGSPHSPFTRQVWHPGHQTTLLRYL